MTATTENERGGLFKKTEEKSAYARQREKRKESLFSRRTAEELYPLQEEIHVQYTDFGINCLPIRTACNNGIGN